MLLSRLINSLILRPSAHHEYQNAAAAFGLKGAWIGLTQASSELVQSGSNNWNAANPALDFMTFCNDFLLFGEAWLPSGSPACPSGPISLSDTGYWRPAICQSNQPANRPIQMVASSVLVIWSSAHGMQSTSVREGKEPVSLSSSLLVSVAPVSRTGLCGYGCEWVAET